ncbi:MAG: glycoside hydrolase family 88 protein [Bacteroidaceae bacterium]|nr:glycoside hydrolase family 88 protein [Bacteroidaceae bacterium]
MNNFLLKTILVSVFCSLFFPVRAERPRKDDVLDIIVMVNDYWQKNNPNHGNWFWNRAVYHVGNMEAYRTTGISKYLDFSTAWAEKNDWSGPQGDNPNHWSYDYGEWNVLFGDCQICFQVYSELYDVKADDERLRRAYQVMDYQVSTDVNDYIWWVDGMFMVMPVLTHLYKQTGNELYLEKMYSYWQYTNSIMYDEETGLYFRDAKYVYPKHQTFTGMKDFWARGDGWAFATFARILAELPENHAHRDEYVAYYKRMADALAACQQPEGHWTRSILDPSYAPGYETSGTSLMLYGYLWGVNNGVFQDEEYSNTIEKAWNYLSGTALHKDGLVGYIQPIGEKADPNQTVSSRSTADFGVGAYLLAASEMYRYAEEPATPRPLRLLSVKGESPYVVILNFNDEVDRASALESDHYKIDGVNVEADIQVEEKSVILNLESPLSYGEHIVEVEGVVSSKGGVMEKSEEYGFYLTVALYPNENIADVYAIANQWGNPPVHVVDNDISTRWSQDGLGQWIEFRLDTVRMVTAVDLAFYQGAVRNSYFDVEVSLDGNTFERVLTACSTSGITDELERYYIEPCKAEYVRIVCNGNSQGGANWNSITEARVVGDKIPSGDTGIIAPVDDIWQVENIWSVDGRMADGLYATCTGGVYIVRERNAAGKINVRKIMIKK